MNIFDFTSQLELDEQGIYRCKKRGGFPILKMEMRSIFC